MPGIFRQFNDSLIAVGHHSVSDTRRIAGMADMDLGAQYEMTLALIKPNAFEKATEIEERIAKEGFAIVERTEAMLTKDEARDFYLDHAGKDFYESLVEFMTSGSIVALALSRENAIKHWRNLLGPGDVEKAKEEAPDSIRALYGDTAGRNGAHGSDSPENAVRELQFFFPDMTLDCFLMSGISSELEDSEFEMIDESVNPVLVEGLRAVHEAQPHNPVEWLADWLRKNTNDPTAGREGNNAEDDEAQQQDQTDADGDDVPLEQDV